MAVLVTMQVGPVDIDRFDAATSELGTRDYAGFRSRKVVHAEDDPRQVLVIEEWDSHEAFHTVGDEFNSRAGTEGLDWITGVWELP